MTPLLPVLLALLPGPQDPPAGTLEGSPRHQEWVRVKRGEREVLAFLVYPEVKTKATAVVVIHENRGLTDWVRRVADRLAEAGYVAIAPDLLSGAGPGGGGTSAFAGEDAARRAIGDLPPDQVTADLSAVAAHAAALPACSGKVAVAGFCWGGAQAFRFATNDDRIRAAFVFYGSAPEDPAALARVACPVYGFYGGDDARVNATIPATSERMKAAGKTYDPVTYEGAGHAFLRSGEASDASEANRKAREEAWKRFLDLLARI